MNTGETMSAREGRHCGHQSPRRTTASLHRQGTTDKYILSLRVLNRVVNTAGSFRLSTGAIFVIVNIAQ